MQIERTEEFRGNVRYVNGVPWEWLGKKADLGAAKIASVSAIFPDGSFQWSIEAGDTIYSFQIDNTSARIFADEVFRDAGSTRGDRQE